MLAHTFRITKEGVLNSEEIIIDPDDIEKYRPLASPIVRPLTHKYTCPLNKFYVTSMDPQSLSAHALTLIGE